ncbi:MAG TPA: tyrosine-type recombinase/integrase [Acidobacteriaceae bacterium]|jgi:integrase
MRIVLTDKYIDNAKSKAKQTDIYDGLCAGLILRVTKEGRKTWSFLFTDPSTAKRARMTLGTYPATSLVTARQRSTEARALVEARKDPRQNEARPSAKTIRELVADRLRLEVTGKVRSADEIKRMYEVNIIPVVGDVPVREFRMSDLNRVIDPMVERGAGISANRCFEVLRALFNFGIRRGELDFNPMAKAKKPTEEVARSRFLTREEIALFWEELDFVLADTVHIPSVLKLCLTTGQRLGEVCGMHREELDMAKRLWTIPAARSKNGYAHVVPLSDLAMTLLREAMKRSNRGFVFPKNDNDEPVDHHIVDKAVARGFKPTEKQPRLKFTMEKWTPHDLRRTAATQMSLEENKMSIPDFIISQVLNHRSATTNSITHRVYIQNSYLPEKREALEKWGNFLAKLVGIEIEQKEAA